MFYVRLPQVCRRYVLCGKEAIHATVQYSRVPEKRRHHKAGIFDNCVPTLTDITLLATLLKFLCGTNPPYVYTM